MEGNIPLDGTVTIGEINCQIYQHNSKNQVEKWLERFGYYYSCWQLEDLGEPLPPPLNPILFSTSSSIYQRVLDKFWNEQSKPLPAKIPYTEAEVRREKNILERIRWILFNFGLSSRLVYENYVIPGNLINPPEQIVKAFSWHKYKQKIALGVGDIIQIYSIINQEGSWEKLETLKIPFQAEINEIQWKPLSGNMLAVACQTGVIVWDSEWMVKFLNIENVKNVTSLQWHPFLPLLAVGSPHDSVIIWDITTSIPTHLHSLSPSSSYLLRWSPNGHYLFHASLDGTFTIWESKTWTNSRFNITDNRVINSASWSPDSHFLAFSFDGSTDFYFLQFNHTPPVIDAELSNQIISIQSLSNLETNLGSISQILWDFSGDRLVVSFRDSNGSGPLIALFSTALSPKLSVNFLGFLRVPGGVQQMEFRPNFAKGALLGVRTTENRLHLLPFYFTQSSSPKDKQLYVR